VPAGAMTEYPRGNSIEKRRAGNFGGASVRVPRRVVSRNEVPTRGRAANSPTATGARLPQRTPLSIHNLKSTGPRDANTFVRPLVQSHGATSDVHHGDFLLYVVDAQPPLVTAAVLGDGHQVPRQGDADIAPGGVTANPAAVGTGYQMGLAVAECHPATTLIPPVPAGLTDGCHGTVGAEAQRTDGTIYGGAPGDLPPVVGEDDSMLCGVEQQAARRRGQGRAWFTEGSDDLGAAQDVDLIVLACGNRNFVAGGKVDDAA